MVVRTPIDLSESRLRDSEFAADILLLLRLVLNDGPAGEQTVAVLRRIAHQTLGIDLPSLEMLLPNVGEFGTDGTESAAGAYRNLPKVERLELAGTLLAVARRDAMLKNRETRLRGRVAAILDLEEGEVG